MAVQNAVLTLTAAVLAVLGGGLFALPQRMAALYGAAAIANGDNGIRTAGAAILALGLLAWMGRVREQTTARGVAVPVLFAWFLLKSCVAYSAVVQRAFHPRVGRAVLFFDVLMALAYGYFLSRREFRRREQSLD